jgi:exopolysaccharide biosynthesis polyprenyl glycosylphosphotransferase
MLRSNAKRLDSLLHAADAGIAAAAFLVVLSAQGQIVDPDGTSPMVRVLGLGLIATLCWPIVLEALGLYQSHRRKSAVQVASRLIGAGVLCTTVIGGAVLALQPPLLQKGLFALTVGVAQTGAVLGTHLAILLVLKRARRHGRNFRNVLIVGSGPRAEGISDHIRMHPEWGMRVMGFADDSDTPVSPALASERVHKLMNIPDLIRSEVIDEVVVAVPRSMIGMVSGAVAVCAEAGIPVTVLSDFFGDSFPAPRVTPFGGHPALTYDVVHHNPAGLLVKRAADIVGSAALLALTAPIMGAVAVAVRSSSSGPVLFRQDRCGKHGRQFEMLKFRTMRRDAEALQEQIMHLNEMDGPVFKVASDPRITRVGAVLRKWSLDELPQLWNVLRGDMSLVGPRPPIPAEVNEYRTFERRRLSMRPGLTCLWQIMGRNAIGFADWVKLDLQYIDSWSLAADVTILVRTIPAVLRGSGS